MEDITSHLMPHLSSHPALRICNSNTTLSVISELGMSKSYDFNAVAKQNSLLVKALLNTGHLVAGESYVLDYDHQNIETEKYDAKMTY